MVLQEDCQDHHALLVLRLYGALLLGMFYAPPKLADVVEADPLTLQRYLWALLAGRRH